ncbi:MAG: hypothetical protein ABI627_08510 [Polyangiaceae bacterium]
MSVPEQGGPGAQFFARYAEPEARLAAGITDSYAACLVLPACGEEPSLLNGFQAALAAAPGRVLFLLVVNATDAANVQTHDANQRLLGALAARFARSEGIRAEGVETRAVLARAENYDVLWLDRASVGARFPEREGVGLARKVGGDLAAALWARGRIACPRIASSDADVTLPDDYFTTLTSAERAPSAAWLWPFHHEAGDDADIDSATVLYEISLRYYVLGLTAARSSYAYQSIGSTICVHAESYLAVRGFPKRAAAEDFYLLDKLAKVGPLRRVAAAPVRIRARRSDRVPFGTGRRTGEIAEKSATGAEFEMYAPGVFTALGAVIAGLEAFAASADVSALNAALDARIPEHAAAARTVLERLGVFAALATAARQAPAGRVLRRRIHTWFDGLRTLRFIHGMRDACLPPVPWRQALSAAEFLDRPFRDGEAPAAVCGVLAQIEAALPALIGPALL